MAKANVLEFLYSKQKSPLEFNFDNLIAPPLLSLLTPQDIYELNRIARSVKLSGKIDEKYKLIDSIMNNRGFVKLHAGTNRVVYRFLEDQSFVIKIAVDKVGLGDNPAEFRNQFLLKPFVTKIFEVSPCGTVALVERVDAIMSREEFASVADDIFNLLTKVFIGKYILEDVGCHYFMNYGIRKNGFGPVLLDFPYVYELDGNKLYCNAHLPGRKDITCGGELDYDDGFNNLICTKCGRHYHARDLKKAEKNQLIIVGGKKTMKVKVMVGKEVILDSSKNKIAKVIEPEPETKLEEITKPVVTENPKVNVSIPRDAIFNRTVKEDNPEPIEVIKDEDITVDPIEVAKDEDVTITALSNEKDNRIGCIILNNIENEELEKSDDIDIPESIKYNEKTGEIIEMNNNKKSNKERLKKDYPNGYDIVDGQIVEKEQVDHNIIYDETVLWHADSDEEKYNDYEDDDEDEEDYEQYLSNRERKQIRQTEKQNRRTDFGDYF